MNPSAGRKTPEQFVHTSSSAPTILFLTVNARNAVPWIGQKNVETSLVEIWKSADAWLVGNYLLMPDHLHLFCAPFRHEFPIETWVTFWKRSFTRKHLDQPWEWQRSSFHHRLRSQTEYAQKWL